MLVLGTMYLFLFALSVALVADYWWVTILLAIFALPCSVAAMDNLRRQSKLGVPVGWQVFFVDFVGYLGWPMTGVLILGALLFTCVSACLTVFR